MPLPQLDTTIDYSNALFRLASDERARQEQADVASNRNIQTQSLVKNRQTQNALYQLQMNKAQAEMKEKELDAGIKQLSLLDYSTPEGVADHNKFKEYMTRINPELGARIPNLDPSDPKSKEVGSMWRGNAVSLLTHGKNGGEFDKVEIFNPTTEEEKIEYTPKGKNYTPPKGWKIYKKEDSKDEPVVATENGYQLRKNAIGLKPYQAPRQAPVPTEKDFDEMAITIGSNPENPAIIPSVDTYNAKAPGYIVFTPHTKTDTILGFNKNDPVSTFKPVDVRTLGVTKDWVNAQAARTGRSAGDIVAALMIIKKRKEAKK
jgi:hypothetical protein